jgi:hypothetical protein
MIRCEDIYRDMIRCKYIYRDMIRCEDIYRDMIGCEDIYRDMIRCEDIYRDMIRCEDIYRDMIGCEDIYRDMIGCEDIYRDNKCTNKRHVCKLVLSCYRRQGLIGTPGVNWNTVKIDGCPKSPFGICPNSPQVSHITSRSTVCNVLSTE